MCDVFLVNGTTFYFKKGTDILHREDGPAVIWKDGSKEWRINGKLHREDGPAIEFADGSTLWWLNGEKVPEEKVLEKS